jgi:hypothetical protein
MSTEYTPGQWIGVVAGNNVAFFDPTFKKEITQDIWQQFKDGATIGELIEKVVSGYNARLSMIPPFAIATTQDKDVHVIVRGDALITTSDEKGTQKITGGTTSTWEEKTIYDPAQVTISLLMDEGTGNDGNNFGIESAIVLTGGMTETLRSVSSTGVDDDEPEAVTNFFQQVTDSPSESAGATDESEVVTEESENGHMVTCASCGAQFEPEPGTKFCIECGAPLSPEQIAQIPAEPIFDQETAGHGKLVISDGQVIELDKSVLVGRKPSSRIQVNGQEPRLVTVSSPNEDISRSHVTFALDGGEVIAQDLHSTNGTTLVHGGESRKLEVDEQYVVQDGDVFDLGDGVTIRCEGMA